MASTKIIQLTKPTKLLKKAALDYRQEHFNAGEYVINGSALFDKITDYDEWLEKAIANSRTETVNPNWVLTDTFFAVRTSDERIVGIIDLRYQLNVFLKDLGNCGYSVRPSERKKGMPQKCSNRYAISLRNTVCSN